MPDNLTAVAGLLAGTFTLFSATMKLREEIDARRDVALGIAKDSQSIPKELRLHILRKDVWERCLAIALLMLSSGAIATGAAAYIWVGAKGVDTYLTVILGLFGLVCLSCGGWVWVFGSRDYRQWEAFIRTAVWQGQRLEISQVGGAIRPSTSKPSA